MITIIFTALVTPFMLTLPALDSIDQGGSAEHFSDSASWYPSPLDSSMTGDAVILRDSGVYMLSNQMIYVQERDGDAWRLAGAISDESLSSRHLVGALQCDSSYLVFSHPSQEWYCLNLSTLSAEEALSLEPCEAINCIYTPSVKRIFWDTESQYRLIATKDMLSPTSVIRDVLDRPANPPIPVRIFQVDRAGHCVGLHFPIWRIKNTISTGYGTITLPHPPDSIRVILATDYYRGVDFSYNFIGNLVANEGDSLYTMYFFDGTVYGASKFGNVIYALVENMGLITFDLEEH